MFKILDFCSSLISKFFKKKNTENAMVMPEIDDLSGIKQYALTFDAYQYRSDLASYCKRMKEIYVQTQTLPLEKNDLRAALYFEFKRLMHRAEMPGEDSMPYIRALYGEILNFSKLNT